jgi:hypothetical protein
MEKTLNGTKGQIVRNAEWKKRRMKKTPNGKKRRMGKTDRLVAKNVEWEKC